MSTLRGTSLAAILAASTPLLGFPGGLDPATQARVTASVKTIREADVYRKSVFLTWGTTPADRYRTLEQFRATRRKASLEAAEALLSVRGSFPKEEWKTLVIHLSDVGGLPVIVEQAQKELAVVVKDEAHRKPAELALAELVTAVKKDQADRESARKKFFSLLEKQSSSRDDFVSGLEKFNDAQAKLDDKIVKSTGDLQSALTSEEWAELVRRISRPRGEGAGKN
ncbi:MAG: hypothetical protein ACHQPI_13255 [Thermoanaerobaculia bacterium]